MSALTKEQFAGHLRRIAVLIESEEHDSYEGAITWEALEESEHYEVKGLYRVNVYGGQGGVHLFDVPANGSGFVNGLDKETDIE